MKTPFYLPLADEDEENTRIEKKKPFRHKNLLLAPLSVVLSRIGGGAARKLDTRPWMRYG